MTCALLAQLSILKSLVTATSAAFHDFHLFILQYSIHLPHSTNKSSTRQQPISRADCCILLLSNVAGLLPSPRPLPVLRWWIDRNLADSANRKNAFCPSRTSKRSSFTRDRNSRQPPSRCALNILAHHFHPVACSPYSTSCTAIAAPALLRQPPLYHRDTAADHYQLRLITPTSILHPPRTPQPQLPRPLSLAESCACDHHNLITTPALLPPP